MNKKLNSFILIIFSIVLLVGCASNNIDKTEAPTEVREISVASLKGPTTIGLAKMIADIESNDNSIDDKADIKYNFDQFGVAEEVVTGLVKGDIDLATIPSNLASTLYNKTEGNIQVLSINTLGVLYIVENSNNINSIDDLSGKTIYSVGKGTTPEGVLNAFIEKNNLENVQIEYKSEASEIAALLKTEDNIIAMLPEPFVSVVKKGNDNVRTIFDMNEEWKKINDGNSIVTGVLVGRKDFLEENKDLVDDFLTEYEKSIAFAQNNIKETANIVETMGIIPEGVGEVSIPNCNIEYIVGDEMVKLLNEYLSDLFNFNPQLIGGTLPKEDFYYNK